MLCTVAPYSAKTALDVLLHSAAVHDFSCSRCHTLCNKEDLRGSTMMKSRFDVSVVLLLLVLQINRS